MLKFSRFLSTILLGILLQSCAKDTDLISEFVVLDAAKSQYRSVEMNPEFKMKKSEENFESVALIPFSN
ncbi:hypothetical protein [Maribacter hydrothermalis]|uniref:Uncharacterized protein n=1 Tax=Maribacter hydrothermalis TaxID=1836467 RepID=A0A1B7ZDN8_9FLAO|nr:hypothetical protein [Maribacter hydrothermalis]APQ16633.1 hypothetical protein BTR34_04470 [Maribacter hydrothermalis]OBR41462.1 hypothetical protein A9200_12565 [Maribacter hydrothermalis]